MSQESAHFSKILETLRALIAYQESKLFESGQEIVPHLTREDLLQPNDFEELELNPYFRYEEGLLAGLMTARAALMALEREICVQKR